MPPSALITAFPVNALPNKLAANVPNKIERSLPFCYFVSFLIVSLILCISNPDSSSDVTIFIISSISLFQIINAVVPNP